MGEWTFDSLLITCGLAVGFSVVAGIGIVLEDLIKRWRR